MPRTDFSKKMMEAIEAERQSGNNHSQSGSFTSNVDQRMAQRDNSYLSKRANSTYTYAKNSYESAIRKATSQDAIDAVRSRALSQYITQLNQEHPERIGNEAQQAVEAANRRADSALQQYQKQYNAAMSRPQVLAATSDQAAGAAVGLANRQLVQDQSAYRQELENASGKSITERLNSAFASDAARKVKASSDLLKSRQDEAKEIKSYHQPITAETVATPPDDAGIGSKVKTATAAAAIEAAKTKMSQARTVSDYNQGVDLYVRTLESSAAKDSKVAEQLARIQMQEQYIKEHASQEQHDQLQREIDSLAQVAQGIAAPSGMLPTADARAQRQVDNQSLVKSKENASARYAQLLRLQQLNDQYMNPVFIVSQLNKAELKRKYDTYTSLVDRIDALRQEADEARKDADIFLRQGKAKEYQDAIDRANACDQQADSLQVSADNITGGDDGYADALVKQGGAAVMTNEAKADRNFARYVDIGKKNGFSPEIRELWGNVDTADAQKYGYVAPVAQRMIDAMSEEQRNTFYYYVGKGDTEKAQEFFSAIEPELEQTVSAGQQMEYAQFTNEHPVAGVAINALSQATIAPVLNLTATAENILSAENRATPILGGTAYIASDANIGAQAGLANALMYGVGNDGGLKGKAGEAMFFGYEETAKKYGMTVDELYDEIKATSGEANMSEEEANRKAIWANRIAGNIVSMANNAAQMGVGMMIGGAAGLGGGAAEGASQNMLQRIIGSIAEEYPLTVMGVNAAADQVRSSLEAGQDWDKALAYGFLCGAVEVVTEKIGMDAFISGAQGELNKSLIGRLFENAAGYNIQTGISTISRAGVRSAIVLALNLGNNALSEGAEEIISNIADATFDIIINGEDSEVAQKRDELMANNPGMDFNTAFQQAMLQIYVKNTVESFGGGAASGLVFGLFGGGAGAFNSAVRLREAQETVGKEILNHSDPVRLIQSGLELKGKNDAIYEMAADLDARVNNNISRTTNEDNTITIEDLGNKGITALDIGKLAYAIENYNTVQEARQTRDDAKLMKKAEASRSGRGSSKAMDALTLSAIGQEINDLNVLPSPKHVNAADLVMGKIATGQTITNADISSLSLQYPAMRDWFGEKIGYEFSTDGRPSNEEVQHAVKQYQETAADRIKEAAALEDATEIFKDVVPYVRADINAQNMADVQSARMDAEAEATLDAMSEDSEIEDAAGIRAAGTVAQINRDAQNAENERASANMSKADWAALERMRGDDGKIGYKEFSDWYIKTHDTKNQAEIHAAHTEANSRYNADATVTLKDGTEVTRAELREMLKKDGTLNDAQIRDAVNHTFAENIEGASKASAESEAESAGRYSVGDIVKDALARGKAKNKYTAENPNKNLEFLASRFSRVLKRLGIKAQVRIDYEWNNPGNGFHNEADGVHYIVLDGQLRGARSITKVLSHETGHDVWVKLLEGGSANQTFMDGVIDEWRKMRNLSEADIDDMIKAKEKFYKRCANMVDKDGKKVFEGLNADKVDFDYAKEEFAADCLGDLMVARGGMTRAVELMDQSLFDRMRERLQTLVANLTGKDRYIVENRKAADELLRMFQDAGEKSEYLRESGQTKSYEDTRHSISTLFSAANLFIEEENGLYVARDANGNVIDEVTADHVENSGIGAMINYAWMESGTITKAEADKQKENVAELLNMVLNSQDGWQTWQFAGATLFSAIKSNSDGQYGSTVDFSTVCKKTQEMVTAMSEAMLKSRRGLSRAEVIELQKRIYDEGGQVPCPVCYVFSRWAGNGGILDNMKRFQDKYGHEYDDATKLNEAIARLEEATQNKDNLRALLLDLDNGDREYQELAAAVESAEAKKAELREKLKNRDVSAEKKDGIKKAIAYFDNTIKQNKKSMADIEKKGAPELAWLKRVRVKPDYWEHGYTDEKVLFNLNDAKTFASKYPLAWGYRTSRGPSAGKAILPYSDMRMGDMVLGKSSNSATGNKTFTRLAGTDSNGNPVWESAVKNGAFNKTQIKKIKDAIERVKAQNIIGGQRFQSTSDFRYDYALDYLQVFWEAQMLGSYMQTYTKVIEFASLAAGVGGDVNLSVMPLRSGLDKDGNLIYSDITGISYEAAAKANEMYDNVQLILVGINDAHILAALDDYSGHGGDKIGFVIPYHASGASINEFISGLVQNLGETFNSSYYRDYSKVQTDSLKKIAGEVDGENESNDTVKAWMDAIRKNPSNPQFNGAAPNAEQMDALMKRFKGELRTIMLTRKTGKKYGASASTFLKNNLDLIRGENVDISGRSFDDLRDVERRALAGDKAAIAEYESWSAGVLWNVYNKMWLDKSRTDTYGVKLTSSQAAAIMPHEYWNTDVDRDHAYVNGFIFRSYCFNLGLNPRFTGVKSDGARLAYVDEADNRIEYGDFSDSTGYWKTLIDRPMYDNNGNYRAQQPINVTDVKGEMLTSEHGEKQWGEYKLQEPDDTRAVRVGRRYGEELMAADVATQAKTQLEQTRYSIPSDEEYMQALADEDDDRAAQIIRDVAASRGYPVEGYHGTKEFGFTVPDTSLSDDRLSFFVTTDIETAQSYSTMDSIRAIHDGGNTAQEIEERQLKAEQDARDKAIDLGTAINEIAGIQGWYDIDYLVKELIGVAEEYAASDDPSMWELEDSLDVLRSDIEWGLFNDFSSEEYDDIDTWLEESDDGKRFNTAWAAAINACKNYAEALAGDTTAGNYHVFINTDNLLEVDGNGAKWNNLAIPMPEDIRSMGDRIDALEAEGAQDHRSDGFKEWVELSRAYIDAVASFKAQYGYEPGQRATTRELARYASKAGYDGVLFKDIVDDGGRGRRVRTPADVYALFKPQQQVRSADTVTVDDNGDIIPPSERFNPDNEKGDFRWSIGADTAQADITAGYEKVVDAVLAGTHQSNGMVLLGYTPKILRDLGVPSIPFVIGPGHIYSAAVDEAKAKADGRYRSNVNYHGLGDATVKSLYEKISEPVMVIASKDVSNTFPVRSMRSVVAIVDIGTGSDELLMPIEITAQSGVDGVQMDVNVLSSAYNKNAAGLIEEAIAQENTGNIGIFYVSKKATAKVASRVQFPTQPTKAAAFGTILHRIPEKVNLKVGDQTQTLQFKRWFGDWQNDPSRASKVVNEDGTPMVVYHGTDADFNIFDTSVRGGEHGTAEGFGIYLSPDQEVTSHYGERQMGLYADIKRPATSFDKTIRQGELVKLIKASCEAEANEMMADDAGYDDIAGALKDTWISNYVDTYSARNMDAAYRQVASDILRMNDNDMDIVQEVMAGMAIRTYDAAMNFYHNILTPVTGIDGFHTRWTNDSTGQSSDIWLAFKSEQLKSATDNIGTFDRNNPDIRYSLPDIDWDADDLNEQLDNWLEAALDSDLSLVDFSNIISQYDDAQLQMLDEAMESEPEREFVPADKEYQELGVKREGDRAKLTPERVDDYYRMFASSSPNYSKAYLTWISPENFLSLTTTDEATIAEHSRELNEEELRNTGPIYLVYNVDNPGTISGHEGRHRMMALKWAGVKSVPVVVLFEGEGWEAKANRQPMDSLRVTGQTFWLGNRGNVQSPGAVELQDLVPINQAHRSEIEQKFMADDSYGGVRFSIDDAAYMAAVNSNDMDRAAEMVAQAAREAGYTVEGYHGTRQFGFTEPSTSYSYDGFGFYVTTELDTAATYSAKDNVRQIGAASNGPVASDSGNYHVFINPTNLMEVDASGARWNAIRFVPDETEDVNGFEETYGFDPDYATTKEIAGYAAAKGYDGAVIKNVVDAGAWFRSNGSIAPSDVYALFKPQQQVRSADPVTYDNDGNVIPLSERFDENKVDMRWSIPSDAAYMDAVNGGDMDEAQRMVDEAAEKAGYRTTKLYHGSKNFGFTSFDLSRMDDGQSIFLTDERFVAESYSGTLLTGTPGGVDGELVNGVKAEDAYTMPIEDAVKMYNELNAHDREWSIMDRNDLEALIKKELDAVHHTGQAAARLLANSESLNEMLDYLRASDQEKFAVQTVLSYIAGFENANTAEDLRKADKAYSDMLDVLKPAYGHAFGAIMMLVDSTNLANNPRFAARHIGLRGETAPLVRNGDNILFDSQFRESLYEAIRSESETESYAMSENGIPNRAGNYALYAKYSNPLVVSPSNSDSANWDDLSFMPEDLKKLRSKMRRLERRNVGNGPISDNAEWVALDKEFWDKADELYDEYGINVNGGNATRNIAAYAKANGYDAVIFEDIYDVGENGYDMYSSNIYVIFDPQSVKSADPVTYDDNGNVIPLSERFNTGNRDIRYQIDYLPGEFDDFENSETPPSAFADYINEDGTENTLDNGTRLLSVPESIRLAKDLRRDGGTRIKTEELATSLRQIWDAAATLPDLFVRGMNGENTADEFNAIYDKVKAMSAELAEQMVDAGRRVQSPYYDADMDDFIKAVLNGKIFIPENVRKNFAEALGYEDFTEFRRKTYGSLGKYITVDANSRAQGIDQVYAELSDRWPGLFPSDTYAPEDMLVRIFDVYHDNLDLKNNKQSVFDSSISGMSREDSIESMAQMIADKAAESVSAEVARLEEEERIRKQAEAARLEREAQRAQKRAERAAAKNEEGADILEAQAAEAAEQADEARLMTQTDEETILEAAHEAGLGGEAAEQRIAAAETEAEPSITEEVPSYGPSLDDIVRATLERTGAISQVRTNTFAKTDIFTEDDFKLAEMAEENFTYDPKSEEASLREARERLDDDYVKWYDTLPEKKDWSGVDLDTAMHIARQTWTEARATGDYSEAVRWAKIIQERGTAGGQFLQAFAKYSRTPEGILTKSIQRLNDMDLGKVGSKRILEIDAQNAALQTALDYQEQQNQLMIDEYANLMKELSDLRQELSDAKKQGREAKKEKTKLERQISRMLDRIAEQAVKISALDNENARLQMQRDFAMNEVQDRIEKISKLGKENTAIVRENSRLDRQIKRAENRYQQLREQRVEIEAARDLIRDFLNRGNLTIEQVTELGDRLANLNNRLKGYQDETTQSIKALRDLMGKLSQTSSAQEIQDVATKSDDAEANEENRMLIEEILSGLDSAKRDRIINEIAECADLLKAVQDGDTESLIEIIIRQARARGFNPGERVVNLLRHQDFEYLNKFALTQLANIADDYEKRSVGKKLSTWQYMAQLMNVRTSLRNLFSNAGFYGIDTFARNGGAWMDALIGHFTGVRTVATSSFFGNQTSAFQGAKDRAGRAALEVMLDVDVGSARSKYGEGSNRTYKMAQRGIARALSRMEMINGFSLNVTDEFFKGAIWQGTINSYAKLVDAGLMTQEEAEQWAEADMLYRTFQDETKIGNMLKKLHDLGNLVGTEEFGLGDFVCKYTRVPGALVTRAIEYSPAGAIKAVYNLFKLKQASANADMQGMAQAQRNFVLGMSRAMTGSMLIAVFCMLAKAGLMKRDEDEEDKNVVAMNRAEGLSGTQINLSAIKRWMDGEDVEWRDGDNLYDIGFMDPLSSAMTMGSLLAKALSDGEGIIGGLTGTNIAMAAAAFSDLSMMNTINDMIYAGVYHDENSDLSPFADVMISLGASSVTGMIPSLIRQSTQAADLNYRDVYGGGEIEEAIGGDTGAALQQAANTIMTAIPGLRQRVPTKLDPMGNEKVYAEGDGATALNIFNSLFNPGKANKYTRGDISNELSNVRAATGDTSFYPDRNGDKTVTYGDEKVRLNDKQRREYLARTGDTYRDIALEVMNSDAYQNATAAEKAEMLKDVKSFSEYKARQALYEELHGSDAGYKPYTTDTWAKTEAGMDLGLSFAEIQNVLRDTSESNMAADVDASGNTIDGTREIKLLNYLNDLDFNDSQKLGLYALIRGGGAASTIEKFTNTMNAGLSFSEAANVRQHYLEVEYQDANTSSLQDVDYYREWLRDNGYSESEISKITDGYTFSRHMTQEPNKMLEGLIASGMDHDTAYDIVEGQRSLQPEEGHASVTAAQKYDAIIGNYDLTPAEKQTAIAALQDDGSVFGRIDTGLSSNLLDAYYRTGNTEYLNANPPTGVTIDKVGRDFTESGLTASQDAYLSVINSAAGGTVDTSNDAWRTFKNIASGAGQLAGLQDLGENWTWERVSSEGSDNMKAYWKAERARQQGIDYWQYAQVYRTVTDAKDEWTKDNNMGYSREKDYVQAILTGGAAGITSGQGSWLYDNIFYPPST